MGQPDREPFGTFILQDLGKALVLQKSEEKKKKKYIYIYRSCVFFWKLNALFSEEIEENTVYFSVYRLG